MHAKIEIIGFPLSNFVRVVRMVCEEKGLPYALTPSLPHSPDVNAIHPFGKIPVLRHGAVTMSESRAIAGYLEALFPEPALFPRDPLALARVEEWVSHVNMTIDRTMIREYVLGYFLASREGRAPDRAAIDAAAAVLRRQVTVLDRAVEATGFLGSDRFSYADLNILPILAGIQAYPEGAEAMAGAPALSAYFARHAERPSFRATAVDLAAA